MASSTMFSRKTLKSFVKKRLCAAAEEIFGVVERIITEYEDQAFSSKQQIEKQQRILDVVLKPQIKLHRTDIPEKRQRIIKQTFEVENEDDDEDFPGFPALDDSLKHEEGSSLGLDEPQSPLQGQGETGWSTLRLLDVRSRGNALSADQEDASPPEIKEEPEELLIIPQIADTSSSTLTLPDRMSGAYTETDKGVKAHTERQETNGPVVKRGRGRPPGTKNPRKVYRGWPRRYTEDSNDLEQTWELLPGRKSQRKIKRERSSSSVIDKLLEEQTPPTTTDKGVKAQTERQETNGSVVKRGRGRPPGTKNPRKVYRGRPRGRPPGSKILDSCARTNAPGYVRRPGSHPIYPISQDSLHLPTCNEEPQEESNSSLDCETSSQPPGEEQLLCPLSYHSDTEDSDHCDDWEQTCQAQPVRKSQRKIKRERYTEDGNDLEQTWELLPGQKSRRKMKRETFYCTVCGKTCSSNAGLKTHMMIHTGEKPFGCRICDKRFRQKGNARLHERSHTGEKPYSCAICGQRFSLKGNMIAHTKKLCGKYLFSSPNIEDPQA